MSSTFALWWLALPLLLLPVWWHRLKRQRTQAVPLATARFLPAAAPQQLRIWRWADPLLLLLRLLLLLAVIAWLADVAVPWRGDTVFVGAQADPAWVEAQIQSAGMGGAQRTVFCTPWADARTPAHPEGCALHIADPLAWLAVHEREWRAGARLAVVATGDAVPMRAHPPVLAHRVDLHLQPAERPTLPNEHHVVLASTREGAWRALFTAFESAGLGRDRYVITAEPDRQTELIVWDRPGAPDAAWRAPLWWAVQPAAFPELAQARRTGGASVADGARGRVWAQDAWPVDRPDALHNALPDALHEARTLFEDRDGLRYEPLPYPAPSMTLDATATPVALQPTAASHALLAPLLALLFALERWLAQRLARQRRAAPALPSADAADAAGSAPNGAGPEGAGR
jgi:hypothetical protein